MLSISCDTTLKICILQLVELHASQQQKEPVVKIVYRGQLMINAEFARENST